MCFHIYDIGPVKSHGVYLLFLLKQSVAYVQLCIVKRRKKNVRVHKLHSICMLDVFFKTRSIAFQKAGDPLFLFPGMDLTLKLTKH